MKVEIGYPLSVFNEVMTVQSRPLVQIDAVYGLRNKTDVSTEVDSGSSGSVTVVNSTTGRDWKLLSGTSAAGFARLLSKRSVRYRPGQGSSFRFTARFPAASSVLGSQSFRCGVYNLTSELSFGIDGTNGFGILHRTTGLPEIRTLTLTVGAGGAETSTITLNGTAINVSLTSGTTVFTSNQIGDTAFTDWTVTSNDSVVIFVSKTVGAKSGTYSFASTGTATGTFAQTSAGVNYSSTWIPQSQWSMDSCDGLGPSGFIFDQTKGNIFLIKKPYLGYGSITFGIKNESHETIWVHKIEYPNKNVGPSVMVPIFKLSYVAENNGTANNTLAIYGASAAGFVDGLFEPFRSVSSFSSAKTTISTTLTPILSIRNRCLFNNTINLAEVLLYYISAASNGNRPAFVSVIKNATLSTNKEWTYYDSTHGLIEYDISATTLTLGANSQEILQFGLSQTESRLVDLHDIFTRLSANETLTIAMKAATSGTLADVVCTINWIDD